MQWIVAFNVVFISLQPLLLLGLLFATGTFELLPKWGYGIVLSWAFYLPLWSLFGVTSTEKPPRLRQVGFIATSFVLPLVMAVVMGESLVVVAVDFSTFHTLGIGLAFGMALIFGPLVEVQIQGMRLTHFRLRRPREILQVANPIPIILLISGILFGVVTLPPIATEVAFYQSTERAIWFWVLRYFWLVPEVLVLYGLLLPKTIYGRPPST